MLTRYRITVGASRAGADDRTEMRNAIIEEVIKHKRGAAGSLVMPAWQGSPEVEPHIVDLYDYLQARASGQLGPGRPPAASTRMPGDRDSR